jgi:hypothetical protein
MSNSIRAPVTATPPSIPPTGNFRAMQVAQDLLVKGALRVTGSTINSGFIETEAGFILEDPGVGINTTTLQAASPLPADYVMSLPPDVGTSGYVLSTDGGVGSSAPTAELSWVPVSSGSTPGAPDNSVQFNDGLGNFSGSTNFTYDPIGTGFSNAGTIILGDVGKFTNIITPSSALASGLDGGNLSIVSGSGDGVGGSGFLQLLGGPSTGSGSGGLVQLLGGPSTGSGRGGLVGISGGNVSGGTGQGGDLRLFSGSSDTGDVRGGQVELKSGDGGNGGLLGVGGKIEITSGTGGSTDGTVGGEIKITSGSSYATNGDGGNITITSGAGTGAGEAGSINIIPGTDAGTNGSVSIGAALTRLGFYGLAIPIAKPNITSAATTVQNIVDALEALGLVTNDP